MKWMALTRKITGVASRVSEGCHLSNKEYTVYLLSTVAARDALAKRDLARQSLASAPCSGSGKQQQPEAIPFSGYTYRCDEIEGNTACDSHADGPCMGSECGAGGPCWRVSNDRPLPSVVIGDNH